MTKFYGWRCAGCRAPIDHQLSLFGNCPSCCVSVEHADWGRVDRGALSDTNTSIAPSSNAAIGTSNTPVSTPRMIVADREVS